MNETDQKGDVDVVAPLARPLRIIAERLPLSKLTAAQTVNCVMDIVGGVLCLAFIFIGQDDLYKLISFLAVLVLSIACVLATDRRRRF